MKKVLLASTSLALLAGLTVPSLGAKPSPGTPRFGKPVLLTIDKYFGGYEPSIVVDKFQNVIVTAHKQNHGDAVSPDSRATAKARTQSWIWYSADHKKFHDMPGTTPAQEQSLVFGNEGDLATDNNGRTYFIDMSVVDSSFSRWKATGRGKLALEHVRPVGPFGQPVDDRPWIAAHGDGVVLYIANMGNKEAYPAGEINGGDGDAYGPGRYTVYMSYDRGETFEPLGRSLNDSGWCRPAADKRPGSKNLYVLCTNDNGTLWSYASLDNGKSWRRYKMGKYNARDDISTYPSVSVAKDGTIYALYNDSVTNSSGYPIESHLRLYTSKTQGRTWTMREVTPRAGQIRYTWLDVAPDGTIGIAYYYRPDSSAAWYLYAGTAKPGQRFKVVSAAPSTPLASRSFGYAFGDFFQVAFGPDSKLHIAYTAMNEDLLLEGLNTDIYYVKQQ